MPKPIVPAPTPLANLRDLGGIPVEGGKIRTGLVFRADDVATTTAEQVAELVKAGLRTIIDLRSADEAERTGRGPSADHPVQYLALPLTDSLGTPTEPAVHLLDSVRSPEHVGQWYAKLLLSQKEALVRGLQAVADSPGAVLFHCAAGKDRTGLFAAALLAVLGAEPEAIAEDYALTQNRLPGVYRRLGLTDLSGGYGIAADHPLLAAHPDAIRSMLATLDARAGGVAAVLRSGGLSSELVGRLRGKLVQPVPAQV
ncbi:MULTISPECIES: tyrosine-protein phosphatase [unclassified Arthrobacter]|uniref:tyrosine-protein phosphatase n=1 Tax=unclassified Arthrobacter TaxID=235627 RepID=UPI001E3C5621|nr:MULTISPECIES: tyrosine-protein phosphatase [unclassified Arthrobacter]MCC9145812.1 tyrosine-protein phosphatase [Arthrobacter sp. zg-Y919]MDK1277041.1 tyrosine-protein phosphatase [Arthrobacter sp. zg.Y919]WIB03570.1 tyrosine-protein phosphatase [Arthrobacter sp. zg-Y919]